ncbi:hypothetical protein Tco_0507482 [Tanacetum coccineum]
MTYLRSANERYRHSEAPSPEFGGPFGGPSFRVRRPLHPSSEAPPPKFGGPSSMSSELKSHSLSTYKRGLPINEEAITEPMSCLNEAAFVMDYLGKEGSVTFMAACVGVCFKKKGRSHSLCAAFLAALRPS